MAPTAETVKLLRWSQDEIDILVQMTNDQLELEAQDASMMISWNQHWKKVSSRLAANGFNRSSTACRGIWKRGVEASRAVSRTDSYFRLCSPVFLRLLLILPR
jgi:hypothetical protein